ncbi:hypothetical protein PSHT_10164 [Puccinia striiformis]|uniref:MULE transposase domain-containing protein n=1 Tax=Puccinia striiformis TaxID=27350 RepID=A0A2S4VBM1_9BASI|nr:hypothetical protein PSHT_10164 [Puccinia striiformis]
MSKPPPLPPDIPPTTTTVTAATTGVTVPLDVWAQMQHFMATFAPLALAPSKPSLPIGTVLLSEPSPTLTPPTITPLAPEPTDQSAIALNSSSPPSPTIPGLDELWKDVEADDPHNEDDNNETFATNKTISNALQKIRREDLKGRSTVEALLDILKETNWSYDIKLTSTGQIQNLFFAHPGSIHLAQINHHIALLDATYQTNQYKLPLVHVVGQAASNQLFTIGFCFLTYEDEENYLWAVTNFKKHIWRPQRTPKVFVTDHNATLRKTWATTFPESQDNLCTWHINTNIAAHCKKDFASMTGEDGWNAFIDLWKLVTYLQNTDIYVKQINNLKVFLKTCPAVLAYLKSSILPEKELHVVAWACQHPHLQNLNISRAEPGHAYLKTFVTNSTGDLLSIFKDLSMAIDSQINHVHESIARDTVRTLVNVPKSFIPLLGKISTFAIKECVEQFKRLKDLDPPEPCSKTLTIGIGIPYAHKIKDILEEGDYYLTPKDFHFQWHLKYNFEFTHIDKPEFDLDDEIQNITVALTTKLPNTIPKLIEQINQLLAGSHQAARIAAPSVKENTKGRPITKTKKARLTSTRREPSAFKIVEAQLKKEKTKRASEAKSKPKPKRVKIIGKACLSRTKSDLVSKTGSDSESEVDEPNDI